VAERPALDAVVFDAGGTLVRLDFEWMSERLAAVGVAASPEAIRHGEIAGRRRYDHSRGRAPRPGELHPPLGTRGDTTAYFGGMLEAAGVPPGRIDAVLRDFFARQSATGLWTRPAEGARAALDGVRRLGLRMAVVSNSDGRAEQHLVDCGVRDGIEFVVDSQIEGIEKPDPGIFRVALERLGVPAARSLYVGDILSVDDAGARAAGMHFVLIDPDGDYGPPGGPAVRSIAELPAWIAAHFAVGATRARAVG
jgi:putative hydrolase of the HAD superfamily